MTENEISKIVVDRALKIHRRLGPGLLESVYEAVFAYELRLAGLAVECQKPMSVNYETVVLNLGFRADLVIDNKVILELKSIEQIALVHKKQLNTYLRITGLKLGLLINFGGALLRNNVFRVVNGLDDSS